MRPVALRGSLARVENDDSVFTADQEELTKKRVASIIAVTVVLFSASFLLAQETREPSDRTSIWMKQKVRASQQILKALADGDFNTIGANAQAMNLLEHLEKWSRADRPEYRTQLRLFEFADHELIRAASEKNIEAATLAYNQLVVSCVNCHKLVRDAKK
jgi:hypothetical protein